MRGQTAGLQWPSEPRYPSPAVWLQASADFPLTCQSQFSCPWVLQKSWERDGGGTDAAPRGHRTGHLTWRKSQPQDNLEGHKATFLIQLVVVLICWNDISKRKTSRHNEVGRQGHWPQLRLAVVGPEILVDQFSPVLLHRTPTLLEIQMAGHRGLGLFWHSFLKRKERTVADLGWDSGH